MNMMQVQAENCKEREVCPIFLFFPNLMNSSMGMMQVKAELGKEREVCSLLLLSNSHKIEYRDGASAILGR